MEKNDTPSLEADPLEKFMTELKLLESNFTVIEIDEKIHTLELLQNIHGSKVVKK